MNLLAEKVKAAAEELFKNLSQKFQSVGAIINQVSTTIQGIINSRKQNFSIPCAKSVLDTLNAKVADVSNKIKKADTEATAALVKITADIKNAKGQGQAEKIADDGLQQLRKIYHDSSVAFDDLTKFLSENIVRTCVRQVNLAIRNGRRRGGRGGKGSSSNGGKGKGKKAGKKSKSAKKSAIKNKFRGLKNNGGNRGGKSSKGSSQGSKKNGSNWNHKSNGGNKSNGAGHRGGKVIIPPVRK